MTAPTILLERSDGPPRNLPLIVTAMLAASLAVTIFVEQHRVAATQRHAAEAALSASNLAARRDTTRTVAHVLGDSVRLFERRIVQVVQRRDALDAALRTERAARYDLTAVVDSLQRSLAAVTAEDAAHRTRLADFDVRQAPYSIAARVEVPAPPDSAKLFLRVALDSIPLEARVNCSAPDAGGIRTASLTTSAPRWATVRLRRLEQSPDVCASPALRAHARRRGLRFSPLMLGAGRSFDARGSSRWSLFVGVGLSL